LKSPTVKCQQSENFVNVRYGQFHNSDQQDITLESCVNKITVGLMIPTGNVIGDYDHARCVGMQKEVGF